MNYNYNTPLYYSFSEFLANYESDFKEWKTFYPEGTEHYFLKVIYDKYNKVPYFNELEIRTEIDYYDREYIEEEVRKKTFSDYIILPYFDGIGKYPRNEKVGFGDLAELITARIRFVLNPELKKGIEVDGIFYNLFLTDNINTSKDIESVLLDIQNIFDRQPTDGFYIDVFKFLSYTPFMEIKKTDDDLGYVYFNEYKYKNFEYTINQILDWIDNKLQNTGFIKSNIKWQGTKTQLTELIKALIENGSIQGTQKDIFNTFTDFLNFDINNSSKLINDIKNRNNGSETIFLDELKSSFLNFINRENKR